MSNKITTPWSDREVELLNQYQRRGEMHPYTCPKEHDRETILVATNDGWVCPDGDGYTQNWAHWGSVRRTKAEDG